MSLRDRILHASASVGMIVVTAIILATLLYLVRLYHRWECTMHWCFASHGGAFTARQL